MTLIEYSLVIALVVVGSVTSLDAMDSKVEAHYEQTALDVGKPSVSGFTVSTTTGGSSTSTTTSTTSSTSSTTTTTTTSPPTTSSTTTTTTTSPPTTTTSAPSGEPATVEAKNWSGYYGSFWKWDVYGELKFKDDDDDKLKNA
ncbi:MAG: hypothetical protein ACE5GB_04610, partial [Acidimicrobiales bacterium]